MDLAYLFGTVTKTHAPKPTFKNQMIHEQRPDIGLE